MYKVGQIVTVKSSLHGRVMCRVVKYRHNTKPYLPFVPMNFAKKLGNNLTLQIERNLMSAVG